MRVSDRARVLRPKTKNGKNRLPGRRPKNFIFIEILICASWSCRVAVRRPSFNKITRLFTSGPRHRDRGSGTSSGRGPARSVTFSAAVVSWPDRDEAGFFFRVFFSKLRRWHGPTFRAKKPVYSKRYAYVYASRNCIIQRVGRRPRLYR